MHGPGPDFASGSAVAGRTHDILGRRAAGMIEDLISDLKSRCTILMVSHYLDQVRRVADNDKTLFPSFPFRTIIENARLEGAGDSSANTRKRFVIRHFRRTEF